MYLLVFMFVLVESLGKLPTLLPCEPPAPPSKSLDDMSKRVRDIETQFAELDRRLQETQDRAHEFEMSEIKRRVAEYRLAGNEKEAREWELLGARLEERYSKTLEKRRRRSLGDYEDLVDKSLIMHLERIASSRAQGKPTGLLEKRLKELLVQKMKYLVLKWTPRALPNKFLRL